MRQKPKVEPFSYYWKAANGSVPHVLVVRLILCAALLYKVFQETGKWTLLFAFLVLLEVELRPLVKAIKYRQLAVIDVRDSGKPVTMVLD